MVPSEDIEQNIDRIFDSVDLIQLNMSANAILELDPDLLESFIRKYSSIVIFFLAILDNKRRRALLDKLTTPALFYIIEEELRMLLLREITAAAHDMEQFLVLSGFLDTFMLSAADSEVEIYTNAKEAMQHLWVARSTLKVRHFDYLESMSRDDLNEVAALLTERNINIALGLLIYIPQDVARTFLDNMAANTQADKLSMVPLPVLNRRVDQGDFEIYVKHLSLLPNEIQRKISAVYDLLKKHKDWIDRIAGAEISHEQKLNGIFAAIKSASPNERKVILRELESRKLIDPREGEMLSAAVHILS